MSTPTKHKLSSGAPASRKKAGAALSPQVIEYLRAWMMSPDHINHPYPTDEEKMKIMEATGISSKQLTCWFSNNRKRYWKPKMEEMGKGDVVEAAMGNTLSPNAIEYLKTWMMSPEHIANPYPTEEEKAQIVSATGIEKKQLTCWFSNNRKRYWKPKIDKLRKKYGLSENDPLTPEVLSEAAGGPVPVLPASVHPPDHLNHSNVAIHADVAIHTDVASHPPTTNIDHADIVNQTDIANLVAAAAASVPEDATPLVTANPLAGITENNFYGGEFVGATNPSEVHHPEVQVHSKKRQKVVSSDDFVAV